MRERTAESLGKEFDQYMKSLAESIGVDMDVFALSATHGNDRLRWAVLIQDRLGELGVLQPRTPVMERPSTGHPPAEYRCGICGGCVRFDGGKPDPNCWPAGKKARMGNG